MVSGRKETTERTGDSTQPTAKAVVKAGAEGEEDSKMAEAEAPVVVVVARVAAVADMAVISSKKRKTSIQICTNSTRYYHL